MVAKARQKFPELQDSMAQEINSQWRRQLFISYKDRQKIFQERELRQELIFLLCKTNFKKKLILMLDEVEDVE